MADSSRNQSLVTQLKINHRSLNKSLPLLLVRCKLHALVKILDGNSETESRDIEPFYVFITCGMDLIYYFAGCCTSEQFTSSI